MLIVQSHVLDIHTDGLIVVEFKAMGVISIITSSRDIEGERIRISSSILSWSMPLLWKIWYVWAIVFF